MHNRLKSSYTLNDYRRGCLILGSLLFTLAPVLTHFTLRLFLCKILDTFGVYRCAICMILAKCEMSRMGASMLLAVQDSSIGDLVTQSVSESVSQVLISATSET